MRSKGSVSTILLISCISLISAEDPAASSTGGQPITEDADSSTSGHPITEDTASSTRGFTAPSAEHSSSVLGPATSLLLTQYGINPASVPATGPKGNLLKGDVLSFIKARKLDKVAPVPDVSAPAASAAAAAAPAAPKPRKVVPRSGYTDHELSNRRKVIAKRLSESKVVVGVVGGFGVFLVVVVVGMITYIMIVDSFSPPSASNPSSSTVPHSNPSNPFSASTVVPVPATNPIGAPPQNTTSPFGGFGASPPATGGFGNQVTAAECFDGFGADSPLASPALDATVDLSDSPMAASALPPDTTPATSPIQCPVCLDSHERILLSGRKLMSTVCGHIFCSACLPTCIKENGRCPTCRKRLLQNNVITIHI